jgi:hypothetical protein
LITGRSAAENQRPSNAIDEASEPGPSRINGLEEAGRAHHVSVEILVEPIEAAANRDLRGQVEHAVDAGQRIGDRRLVAHVAVDEARLAGNDLAAADRQVVEHGDAAAFAEERAGEV